MPPYPMDPPVKPEDDTVEELFGMTVVEIQNGSRPKNASPLRHGSNQFPHHPETAPVMNGWAVLA